MMRRMFSGVVLSLVLVSIVHAQDESKHYNLESGKVAIKGYDPVSYFIADKPSKGSEKITTTYQGVVFRFASEENRKKFLETPTKYLPEYGGWCAKAIADKDYVDIDPLNYKITGGRLFLFYKGFFGDALKIWNADEANMTKKADANWKVMTAK